MAGDEEYIDIDGSMFEGVQEIFSFRIINPVTLTQLTFTYSKLTTETLEKGVKYIQS